jgi:hypothetical protein
VPDEVERIAERVAEDHNRWVRGGLCRGVLIYSAEGWYPRWAEEKWGHPPDKIVVEVRDGEQIGADEVMRLLQERDAEIEAARAFRERQEMEASVRRRPEDRSSGWREGQPRCGACKLFIASPDARCESCGFENNGVGYGTGSRW